MQKFVQHWQKITRDSFVLKAVAQGITIPLVSKPVQTRWPHEIKMTEQQVRFVDDKIKNLLASRCIVPLFAFDPTGFLSKIFLVPKKELNSFRMILNLRNLNSFVRTPHFKMESLKDVQRLVRKHSWICTCDIRDAYLHFRARGTSKNYSSFPGKVNTMHSAQCLRAWPMRLTFSPEFVNK